MLTNPVLEDLSWLDESIQTAVDYYDFLVDLYHYAVSIGDMGRATAVVVLQNMERLDALFALSQCTFLILGLVLVWNINLSRRIK